MPDRPYDIEYLGRIDDQVKVRGFRIELREIEHQLLSHPHIRDGVVVVKEAHRADGPAESQATHRLLCPYPARSCSRCPVTGTAPGHSARLYGARGVRSAGKPSPDA